MFVPPSLGRMSLATDQMKVSSIANVKQFMKWMRQVPFTYVPFFMVPLPALASAVPEGFEEFPALNEGIHGNLIDINK